MKKESETNQEYAKELSKLILENPGMRVIAWIDSEGISDDYASWAGNLRKPRIQTIAYSDHDEHYIEKEGDDFEDCYNYYGSSAEAWTYAELEEYAKQIPWEDVIAVHVSVF